MWNVLTVPTVWYFNCHRQCWMFLLFLQCGILTVPDNVECSYCSWTVKIPHCRNSNNISHCRGHCTLSGTVIIPHCRNNNNIPHSKGQLTYKTTTMWNVITVPTVWYFNCPRQCWMFLLFLQCGILTVPDNVECSRCSYIVVFWGQLKYHTVGIVRTFHIVENS
jgi:hypothetical protein